MLQHPKAFGDHEEYRVTERLGSGSYAHTYLVVFQGKKFALKWMRPDTESGARADKRFENEIWALEKLNHPSIPHLIATGEKEGRPYIVMSFAKGTQLRKLYEEQREERGAISERKMLRITAALLKTLAYIDGEGVFHRDLKDANVVFDDASGRVTLLDFGMCKGPGKPAKADTFWNAGASRYSPPEKLKYPAKTHPTHDVFAVGVLGYQLLTNQFPWDADAEEEDRGKLEDMMRTETPPRIHNVNTMVTRQTSEFYSSLLEIDDDRRPTAHEALAKLKQLEGTVGSHTRSIRAITYPRVIRDPLHSDIVMTEFEWKLMNSREFQRLRWLRQLATANFVYPGAEHTRFAHAVGTLHIASTIMRRI